MESYSLVQCIRRLMGQPVYCSAADAGAWRERGYGDGSTLYAWLSRIALLPWLPGFPPQAISHHNLYPHIPSSSLSAVSSSPCAGIAPQSLNSSSQLLSLPGDPPSCPHMYGCGKDCLILIPFRLPQISCSTLSLKCFSSDNCSDVGTGLLLQFPHLPRIVPVQ